MDTCGPELDRTVPALLVKVGRYPQHHGGVGAIRTLGRCGVPVYAMVEDRFTPAALSRRLAGRFVCPTSGLEEPAALVDALLRVGEAIGRRAVAVPTDDEAAVLLAEHADRLGRYFLLPPVPADLPRELASKAGLHRLCGEYGVPTPRAAAPAGHDALLALAREWGYPLILKNLEAWTRLRAPVVGATTLVRDEAELLAAVPPAGASSVPSVLVQEYLPPESSQDWFTHLYCPADGAAHLVFTGRKLRSWPPQAGVTTRACALPNPELADAASEFCRKLDYRGAADLDWRLDVRDGHYKLLDFNPRTGAQFRVFENERGVDVVRAMHLDLTGRPIPMAPQREPRTFVVGQLDLPSALCAAWRERRLPPGLLLGELLSRDVERAWLCRDDPLPAAAEVFRFGGTVAGRITRALS